MPPLARRWTWRGWARARSCAVVLLTESLPHLHIHRLGESACLDVRERLCLLEPPQFGHPAPKPRHDMIRPPLGDAEAPRAEGVEAGRASHDGIQLWGVTSRNRKECALTAEELTEGRAGFSLFSYHKNQRAVSFATHVTHANTHVTRTPVPTDSHHGVICASRGLTAPVTTPSPVNSTTPTMPITISGTASCVVMRSPADSSPRSDHTPPAKCASASY